MKDIINQGDDKNRAVSEINRQAASLYLSQKEYHSAESTVSEIWERMYIITDLLEGAGQPFVSVYPHGGIIVCNRSFCELTGYAEEELKSMGWWDFTPTEWHGRAKKILYDISCSGVSRCFQKEYVHKSGLRIPVEVFAYPVYAGQKISCYVMFVSNIALREHSHSSADTNREEPAADERDPGPSPGNGAPGFNDSPDLSVANGDTSGESPGQKEEARLDRLKLVGEMAAGMSHELRNPMTTVKGFVQMFMGKQEFEQYKDYLKIMLKELDRANLIISSTLSLDKNRFIDLKPENLNHIVESLSPLILTEAVQKDSFFKMELGNIPNLLLDKKEIRQLMLNLVHNGLEAMPRGGCLIVKTYSTAKNVVLSVQDQGTGITPDVFDKMGIPFFTTKETGIGLGLAICYNIADRHNAVIKVESGPGGTEVKVIFKI